MYNFISVVVVDAETSGLWLKRGFQPSRLAGCEPKAQGSAVHCEAWASSSAIAGANLVIHGRVPEHMVLGASTWGEVGFSWLVGRIRLPHG